MSVPDYQQFMLPVLQFAEDGKLHTMSELRTYCYRKMNVFPVAAVPPTAEFTGPRPT